MRFGRWIMGIEHIFQTGRLGRNINTTRERNKDISWMYYLELKRKAGEICIFVLLRSIGCIIGYYSILFFSFSILSILYTTLSHCLGKLVKKSLRK